MLEQSIELFCQSVISTIFFNFTRTLIACEGMVESTNFQVESAFKLNELSSAYRHVSIRPLLAEFCIEMDVIGTMD